MAVNVAILFKRKRESLKQKCSIMRKHMILDHEYGFSLLIFLKFGQEVKLSSNVF